jgi:solute:Na+ symporter, SSS family
MSLTGVTLFLLIIYLAIVKTASFYACRISKSSAEDYFLVNRTLGSLFLVGTIVASIVNSLSVTGVPSLVYRGGILILQMFIVPIGIAGLMWVFGPKIWAVGKNKGFITQGEIFGDYYHSRTLLFITAIICLLAVFPFMVVQLSGIGKIFSAATNNAISYELAVLVCSLSIGTYLYFGGARAVVWTDIIQGTLFFSFLIISAILFTHWAGGYGVGLEKLSMVIPEKLQFNSENTSLLVDNILSWSFAFFLWPHLFQRMFMAKSKAEIRHTALLTFIILTIVVMCVTTIGIMSTAVLFESVRDPDRLVAEMYCTYLPAGGSMLVIAVFAAGMSTVDSILLTLSSIVSRDLVQRTFKLRLGEKREFVLGRSIAILFLVIVTLFAFSKIGRGAIVSLVTLGASFATLNLWPLLGVFFWHRGTREGVIAAMVSGFAVICIARFTELGAKLPFGFATAGFLAGLICFVLVSFLTDGSKNKAKRREYEGLLSEHH